MENQAIRQAIQSGETCLGIELGSTRIKAVLIGPDHTSIATGAHDWENRLEDGVWTYRLDDVWAGIQDAYAKLATDVREKYGEPLTRVAALGVSGMMHGYLAFNAAGKQLAPFRTWRNTMTEEAAVELTDLFGFNIPQRWSVAHLYQAILNKEAHVKQISLLTTLAGYVHWKLTGQKVLGVGEASGMFPVDSELCTYEAGMLRQFDGLLKAHEIPFKLCEILPTALTAGTPAGTLTDKGAALLDPSGTLEAGAPLCPPEGDAGTGMVATNSIAPRTGNISAGTSVFAMAVLERPLSKVYPEIDMVSTPAGAAVAMVHCNTCTSDLDAWVSLFGETLTMVGILLNKTELYSLLYCKALEGENDCGGLLAYNYYSGEPVTGMAEGCPLLVRKPESNLTLANLMRVQLYSAVATLKLGMDFLLEKEQVALDRLTGHGGLFKVKGVAQRFLAGALDVPIAVMETAGEGGPWGMALLASYMVHKTESESLEHYLNTNIFSETTESCVLPDEPTKVGFAQFIQRYRAGLEIERVAGKTLY